ncbi:DUF4184 family protein [bacterium]|nr:DUF4184 family protein [bacterium]
MIAPTHAIYGPAIALIFLAVFGVETSFHWTIVLCAILGSLAPDIDHPTSTIGRLVPWISKPIERKYGHRAVTHSLIGTVVATIVFAIILSIAALVLQQVLNHQISMAMIPISLKILHLTLTDIIRLTASFSIGYASHIVLDMLTPRGVQLLWPNPNRDVWFKNSLQIETASKGEIPVALVGTVLLALALPLSQYGPMTALRWFLATPEAAIAEYKTSPTATFVEFDGIWSATKQPIKGTAEILDVQNKRLVVALQSPQSEEAASSPLPIPANRSRDGLHLRGSDTAKRKPNDVGHRTSDAGHSPSDNSKSMSDASASHHPVIALSHSDSPTTRELIAFCG